MKSVINVVFRRVIEFFVFMITWFIGFTVGYICNILGVHKEFVLLLGGGDELSEVEEMIENMNEIGPNN